MHPTSEQLPPQFILGKIDAYLYAAESGWLSEPAALEAIRMVMEPLREEWREHEEGGA